MEDHYYTGTYIEYDNGNVKGTGNFLIRATAEQTNEDIKAFLRSEMQNPKAVLTIATKNKIDHSTFVALGGQPNAPWFGPFK